MAPTSRSADVRRDPSRAAALLGCVALCASTIRPARAQATTVRVGSSPNDDLTAAIFAERTGMFAKAGFDIVFEKTSNGAAAAAAVAAGALDIGKSSITALLSAHEKGLPFVVIAAAGSYENDHPDGVLLVRKDASIRTGKDLEGTTLSVSSLASLTRIGIPGGPARRRLRDREVRRDPPVGRRGGGRAASGQRRRDRRAGPVGALRDRAVRRSP